MNKMTKWKVIIQQQEFTQINGNFQLKMACWMYMLTLTPAPNLTKMKIKSHIDKEMEERATATKPRNSKVNV